MTGNRLLFVIYSLIAAGLIITANACVPVITSVPPSSSVPPPNNIPQISQIAAPQVVIVSTAVEMTCIATDVDDDLLAYNWIAGTGTIAGSGVSIKWIAPPVPGIYSVTAIVTDSRGGEVTKSVLIDVVDIPNNPPEISKILVTKQDRTEMVVSPGDVRPILTRPWNVITLECFADDAEKSEIKYDWKTPGGKIDGSGKTVKFIPFEKDEIIVTVTVTDSRGATTKADIHFYSDCCGHYPAGAREY